MKGTGADVPEPVEMVTGICRPGGAGMPAGTTALHVVWVGHETDPWAPPNSTVMDPSELKKFEPVNVTC